jgi:DUF2934 family protein
MTHPAVGNDQYRTESASAGGEAREWQLPTEDEIRRRAYELYLEREMESGGALDDWLEAEAELLLAHRRE